MYIYIRIYIIYTHICIYIHTHTHTRTHAHVFRPFPQATSLSDSALATLSPPPNGAATAQSSVSAAETATGGAEGDRPESNPALRHWAQIVLHDMEEVLYHVDMGNVIDLVGNPLLTRRTVYSRAQVRAKG